MVVVAVTVRGLEVLHHDARLGTREHDVGDVPAERLVPRRIDLLHDATDGLHRFLARLLGRAIGLMLLGLADGGKTLVRRDYGDGAAPDAMRYTRCA